MNFDELKAEYLDGNTSEERKNELIPAMQDSLRMQCRNNCEDFTCIKKRICSATTDNVDSFKDIYDELVTEAYGLMREKLAEITRKKQTARNKYNENNKYPQE